MKKYFFSFLSLGLAVAIAFPFYAQFFVVYKEGMFFWFVVGCLVAGSIIGVGNFFMFKFSLKRFIRSVSKKLISESEELRVKSCQSKEDITKIYNKFTEIKI